MPIQCTCLTCGREFPRRPSSAPTTRYCSRPCYAARPPIRVRCTCLTCGTFFMREGRRMVGPTYCSRACFYRRRPRGLLFSEDGSKALVPLLDKDGELKDYAIIDPADADDLSSWAWTENGSGYAVRTDWLGGKVAIIRMHRQLLGLTHGDGLIGDHINRNPLDNRRANLRILTSRGNAQNVSPRQGGTSQYRGVYWSTRDQRWRTCVSVDGATYQLGAYDSEEEADVAVRKARAWLMPYAVD